MTSWSSRPASSDGFTGGRVVSVLTPTKYLWYQQPMRPAKLVADNEWTEVVDTSLSFTLAEPSSIRLAYSMTVRPDQQNSTDQLRRRDDVEARLLVDGLPYRETGSVVSLTCVIACAGILEGAVTLPLRQGNHTVKLQWKRFGRFSNAWRNDPSLLDGYASSRTLVALGDRFDVAGLDMMLGPSVVKDKKWATVGGKTMAFHLVSEAVVLFTYALPVSQHGNPNFDSWTYERWSAIDARLVVDSVPYRQVQVYSFPPLVEHVRALLALVTSASMNSLFVCAMILQVFGHYIGW